MILIPNLLSLLFTESIVIDIYDSFLVFGFPTHARKRYNQTVERGYLQSTLLVCNWSYLFSLLFSVASYLNIHF